MSRAILADARRQSLIRQLLERGSITVGTSASEFNVSTETIRKDILYLERLGVARKCFGGAVAVEGAAPFGAARKAGYSLAKAAIAARAMDFIEDGTSIFIDGGTTAFALSEAVAQRSDLTVFTNSMSAVEPLSHSGNHVFVVGGRLRMPGLSNVGPWAVQAMRSTNIDTAFLGTDGLHGTTGPTSSSYDETNFKATVIASSRQTVVLGDSTKFSHTGLFVFTEWKEVDIFITDEGVPAADCEALERETRVVVESEDPAILDS